MMKKVTSFTVCLLVVFQSVVCQKRNNIWPVGVGLTFQAYPRPFISFNTATADTFSLARQMGFFITNTSISDTAGNLLFYTNGNYIANANHDTLQNSEYFNPGYASTINSNQLNIVQGALILPMPGNDSLYYVFHVSGEQFTAYNQLQQQPLQLSYSIVNMKLDSMRGGIIAGQKNIAILNDTLTNGMITACKHGNGRDWWITVPRFYSNKYYKFLLTDTGLAGPFSQNIGSPIVYDIGSQASFSPQGDSYAQVNIDNTLNIFKFDRCTGLFYDNTFIQIPNPTLGLPDNEAFGLAFSPSGQYLYIVLYTKIVQYDTWATNIASTQTYVADWDTAYNPFATYFLLAQLAPDGKIYIGTYGSCYTLHYIDQPDVGGVACNVVQNSFPLTSIPNVGVPTFPNYDLGAWVGSPCDTLTLLTPSLSKGEGAIRIAPNPANNSFYIKYDIPTNENLFFVLYDSFGKEVLRKNLYGSFKNLLVHTEQLNNGIYFWRAVQDYNTKTQRSNGKPPVGGLGVGAQNGKIVILH